MLRALFVIIIIVVAVALFNILWDSGAKRYKESRLDKRHRNWIPGSKPMAKPPAGKDWRYDVHREEWYLDDD